MRRAHDMTWRGVTPALRPAHLARWFRPVMKFRSTSLFVLGVCGWLALASSTLAALPYIFSGEGLTIVVLQEDEETGRLAGNLRLGARQHAFRGVAEEGEAGSTVTGNVTTEAGTQPFAATLSADGERVTFSYAGKTYRLTKTDRVPPAPPSPTRPPGPAPKPSEEPTSPSLPTPLAETDPAMEEPAVDESPADETAPATSDAAALALQRVEFPDINMGGVPAYSMLIPRGWRVDQGHILWSDNYPQRRVRILGPDHEKIAFIPLLTFSYTESNLMAPQGTPPPPRLGEWLVKFLPQNNQEVSEMVLIEDRRDPQVEAQMAQLNRQLGGVTNAHQQAHIITYEYTENGVRKREEARLSYATLPPMDTGNIRSVIWTLAANSLVATRAERFAELHPLLLTLSGTCQTLPKWWNQMMQARQEIIEQRHRDGMEAIRRRGQFYDQMSDAQFAAWKRWNRSDDEIQRRRIQGINEATDYQDRNGQTVELPFHYKHVFSDGQGNYLLSNRYQPPTGYEEIPAAR